MARNFSHGVVEECNVGEYNIHAEGLSWCVVVKPFPSRTMEVS